MVAITMASIHTIRTITPRPWLHLHTLRRISPHSHSLSTTSLASLSPLSIEEQDDSDHPSSLANPTNNTENTSPKPHKNPYFPKRGQTLELVCDSLAFKGKGVCKVPETGFVLMCDRALPGERFVGRVTRRKGSYAEVMKLRTLSPHLDAVDAPCEYASYCGGCKTQNLSYEAQLRFKEDQVRELMIHVGKFPDRHPEVESIVKPIVPCENQFHYRNKMEFSFSTWRWIPRELLEAEQGSGNDYALGLHAPGFFDKVLNVNKCLLQSEPANAVLLAEDRKSVV